MSLLSVVEYQTVLVRAKRETTDHEALSTHEIDVLHRIGARLGVRLIEHASRTHVRFQQYVGLVRVGGRDIELLPKIESAQGDEPSSLVRQNLLRMLLVAHGTKIHLPGNAQSALAQVSWLDAFIQLFCRELAEQVRRGLTRRYREEKDDLHVVQGCILIDQQVTRNLVHKERVACEFDELDENHPLNQMFKLALTKMLLLARSNSTQRAVRELLLPFDSVVLRPSTGDWWRSVQLDRMTAHFESAKHMAQMFLSGFSPNVTGGGDDSFALLFDMNQLFEEYVGRVLRRALSNEGLQVNLQHARHHLMRTAEGGTNLFMLKPDIVVTSNGNAVCIGDTKWKRLSLTERKLGVSQADLYQMLAYAHRYRCDRVLMLYPFHREAGVITAGGNMLTYQERETTVLIGLVCLSDLSTVPAQLSALFRRALGGNVIDAYVEPVAFTA